MSKEFVMVPRADLVSLVEHAEDELKYIGTDLQDIVKSVRWSLSTQHQSEPVALPTHREYPGSDKYGSFDPQLQEDCSEVAGWNACLDEIAKLGPPYIHVDPGEVERLREGISKHWKVVCDQRAEIDALRAQLRVQDALLDEAYQHDIGTPLKRKMRAQRAALSASAEPVNNLCAPKKETHDEMRIRHKREFDALEGGGFHYEECRCGARGSYPVEVRHCVCSKEFARAALERKP